VVSAMLAGLAGALYVPQVGIINPGEFSPANSIEIVIWVALGGRGTLVGAALGAVIVAAAKSWLTAAWPDAWLFVLGAMFVLVTIFLPKGVLGVIEGALARLRPAPRAPAPDIDLPPEPERAETPRGETHEPARPGKPLEA
jgi:urea transport system permease protein